MRKLIVSIQGQLQGDAEGLDGHDGYRSNCRTYGYVYEWVSLAIYGSDLVDHDTREYGDCSAVKEECCIGDDFQH